VAAVQAQPCRQPIIHGRRRRRQVGQHVQGTATVKRPAHLQQSRRRQLPGATAHARQQRHQHTSALLQQMGVQRQPVGVAGAAALGPVQPAALERGLVVGIGDAAAQRRVAKAESTELVAAAGRDGTRQIAFEVAEVQEGRRRGELFTHEEHRQRRCQQHASQHRAQGHVTLCCARQLRDAFAEGTVADLVVSLQTIDEGQWRQRAAGRAVRRAAAKGRSLALEGKALGQRAAQKGHGLLGIVGVITIDLGGGEHVQRVVQVVVPLRVGQHGSAFAVTLQVSGVVGLVFQHQVHDARAARPVAHGLCQRVHDMRRRTVVHGVHGVDAQAVEVELLQPVQRVVDEEVAHPAAARALEVDGRAPGRVQRRIEEVGCVGVQVVALGSEVVVDHVQQHHQSTLVRGGHKGLQIVGRAVAGFGGERQHAVVAPAAATGKVGHRHQLTR
jgi:hypothetical protein